MEGIMFNKKRHTSINETNKNKNKLFDKEVEKSTIMGQIFRSVLLASFITLILFTITYTYFMYQQKKQNYVNILEKQTKSICAEYSEYFKNTTTIIDILSYSRNLKDANHVEYNKSLLLEVLAKIESNNLGLSNIAVAYEDNTIISKSINISDDYNLKEAQWYKKAIYSNDHQITLDSLTCPDGITRQRLYISKSFEKNGVKKGVIFSDCTLDNLNSLISSSFLYSSNSVLLVNKADKRIISNNPSPINQEIITKNPQLFTNSTLSLTTKIDGTKYLIQSRELPILDWLIISRLDFSEVTDLIIPKNLIILTMLILLMFVISKIIASLLGKKFAKPIIEVSSALQNLAQGEKNIQPLSVMSNNEIGTMAESFNTFLKNTEDLVTDINHLKKTKADLSYSLSLLNASLESTEDGILITDSKAHITKWNQRFLEIWDLSEEFMVSTRDVKFLPDVNDKVVNPEKFYQTINEIRQNQEKITFDIIEFVNGTVIERYSFPQKIENKIVGRVWRYRDITQKKKSELLLKESEERYRVMFTKAIDSYSILDGDKIIDTNKATLKMLGVSREWLLGKSPLDVSPEYQPDGKLSKEEISLKIQQAMETGKLSFTWEHIRGDGTPFPAEITLVKIHIKDKELLLNIWKDLSEEKKIAEELKTSEQNFRLLFESMLDMLFITDLEGNIKYTNKAAQEKLGYSLEELTRMNVIDLNDTSGNPEANQIIKTLADGTNDKCNLPAITKKGNIIPVETKTWLGKWNGEKSLFAISKDISKEQEALLKFNKLFKNNPNPLILISYPERKFIDVNDAFCATLGYSKQEVVGLDINDLNMTKEVDKIILAIRKLIRSGSFSNLNIKLSTKTGKMIDCLFSGELIETNGTKFVLTAMTNITDLKNLGRMLVKSEQKYRLLFENMTSAFALHEMIFDDQGKPIDYKFLAVNPAFENYTGLVAKNIIGKRIKEVMKNIDDIWIKSYGQVVITGQPASFEQYSQEFDKYFDVRAFTTESNKFATIFSEITTRVKALKALEKEKELAQAATKAKSEFLANMSHEIRTPLNGVIGFTDLLLSTELTPSQREFSANANSSGKALLNIINDILDFSKIEAGKMDLELVDSSIEKTIKDTVDVIKYSACKKGIDIIINIPPELPEKAMIDPLRLKQILLNLLNNAVKFTTQGEIEISVKFNSLEHNNGRFMFSIRDTGIGISEEASKNIFDAFSQADSSITRKYGGTGLGLVISNMLANKMGAKIGFDSEVGKGSEFYFTLTTKHHGKSTSKKLILKGNRILLADKNTRFMETTKSKFEYWGLGVELASSQNEIVEKLNTSLFNILLLDERLLDKNSYQQINELILKINSNTMKTYVIISACPLKNVAAIKRSKKYDISHILSKPLYDDEMFNSIKDICSNGVVTHPDKKVFQNKFEKINSDKVLRILIAEDVEMNMILIKALINKIINNVEIYEAKNGMEAVNIFKKQAVDLVLMDVQMPELDGLEATKAIKKIEEKRKTRTPVIALTAAAYTDDKDKCLTAGMVGFLTKPINIKELTNVLEKYTKNEKREM